MSPTILTQQPIPLSPLPQHIELEDINLDNYTIQESAGSEIPNQDQALDEHFADNENANLMGPYPRPDGGKEAWLFLAGCVAIEMMVWGFAFTFGVFQEYYEDNPVFAGSANVATVGTTQSGIMYISAPVVFAMILRWPQIQRACCVVGLLLLCLSLACSSFATTVGGLIATQGVIYAIGGALIYAPAVVFLDGWFIKRKGLAFGVMWAGTGLAGVIFPLVIGASLERFGHRTTLRALSVFIFVLTMPLLHFVKARVPISITSPRRKRFDLSFLWSPTFVLFQGANVLQGLGYFLPQIYLPTYASEIQNNSTLSTLTLVLFNVASVGGCILMGCMIDRFHVTTCILMSSVPAALGVFLFWGFSGSATGLSLLYIFCVVYGFFAGAYTSAWPGVIRLVLSKQQAAEPNMIFGFLALGRGIGNVVSGPLSTALLQHTAGGAARLGYSSEYAPLIVFSGITALLGGASILGRLRSGLV